MNIFWILVTVIITAGIAILLWMLSNESYDYGSSGRFNKSADNMRIMALVIIGIGIVVIILLL